MLYQGCTVMRLLWNGKTKTCGCHALEDAGLAVFARIDTDIVGCLERNFVVCFDGNRFTRLWIFPFTLGNMLDGEVSKVRNGNVFVAFCKVVCNGSQYSVEAFGSIVL